MTLELSGIVLPLGHFPLRLSVTLGGGITGLSGPSGSGKTSLLEVIAGLRRPAAGRILLDGVTLLDAGAGIFVPPWRRRMGYVPQDQALFPHLDVRRNLVSSARLTGSHPDADLFARISDLLELEPLLTRKTALLSGGEKARVALGRALLSRPAFLLLDEPMAHLDDRLREKSLSYLRTAAAELALPVLMVSHSAMELEAVCSTVLRMEQGALLPSP